MTVVVVVFAQDVAVRFAASACPLVFKFETKDFMSRGADISFLSVRNPSPAPAAGPAPDRAGAACASLLLPGLGLCLLNFF